MTAAISVVIVAQNEERTIGKVLAAVKPLAHEIILVDSGSTDNTINIARQFGVRYYHQNWLGYAKQKNYAIGLAQGNWILSLDADEILTPELVSEIRSVLNNPNAENHAGFLIPRVLYIGDRPVRHGGFYPDAQLRLFRKGKGKFNERLVHEAITVDGSTKALRNHMLHFAYSNVTEFQLAMEKYARLSAQEFATRSGAKPSVSDVSNNLDMVTCQPSRDMSKEAIRMQTMVGSSLGSLNELVHPWWSLFYRYIIRAGFLDGKLGWQLNWLYSDYVRKKIRYLREERAKQRQRCPRHLL